MKFRIICAGKPSLNYAKEGIQEYMKRLKRYGHYDLQFVKAGSSEEVSARLLAASESSLRIAMDERGVLLSTSKMQNQLTTWEDRGDLKSISFLIGAADGHTESLRQQCDAVWGLSSLTLMHELALLVLSEQLYRCATIKRGEPYHR